MANCRGRGRGRQSTATRTYCVWKQYDCQRDSYISTHPILLVGRGRYRSRERKRSPSFVHGNLEQGCMYKRVWDILMWKKVVGCLDEGGKRTIKGKSRAWGAGMGTEYSYMQSNHAHVRKRSALKQHIKSILHICSIHTYICGASEATFHTTGNSDSPHMAKCHPVFRLYLRL